MASELIQPAREQAGIGRAWARAVARAADHDVSARLPEPAAPRIGVPIHPAAIRLSARDPRGNNRCRRGGATCGASIRRTARLQRRLGHKSR